MIQFKMTRTLEWYVSKTLWWRAKCLTGANIVVPKLMFCRKLNSNKPIAGTFTKSLPTNHSTGLLCTYTQTYGAETSPLAMEEYVFFYFSHFVYICIHCLPTILLFLYSRILKEDKIHVRNILKFNTLRVHF